MNLHYTVNDILQAFLGAMTGIFGLMLFFVFGEVRNGAVIEPVVGILFTVCYLTLAYFGMKKYVRKGVITHLLIDYAICIILAVMLTSFIFKITPLSSLKGLEFFGSIGIIVSWICLVPSVVFDIKETMSFIERFTYYAGNGNGTSQLQTNPIETYCRYKYKDKESIDKCIHTS